MGRSDGSNQSQYHALGTSPRPSSQTVPLGQVQPQAPMFRTVYCNDREANSQTRFKGNSISTTKYNVLNFLPKGLFEQFRRTANFYFLGVACLSMTSISPISPVTEVVPLIIVLSVSLVKEAFEDWKRFQNDMSINDSSIEVLQDRKWVVIPWKKLQVGDVVKVNQDEYFPADIVFLGSTNHDGVCYIETANLDGETNLKIRKALERTWEYITPEKASEFKGEVECEKPNNSLYTFTGNLILKKQTVPLSPDQLLLRGCSLRNTEYIVGTVIFTGQDTKVMMNTMDAPSKISTFEKKLDKLIITVFYILVTMCLTGSICCAVVTDGKHYYLDIKKNDWEFRNPFLIAFFTFFTLMALFSTMIPISLYVSLEMIKLIQCAQFIDKDLHMYHAETDTPALARTSNLNEQLGQVEYIFSDKTGTLTRNLMEFFKCSIGGERYGCGITEMERERKGISIQEMSKSKSVEAISEKGFNFDDSRLMRGAWRNEANPDLCVEFFRCLAICHTVLTEGGDSPENNIVYQASSPDEAALVTAAKNFGFFFYRRTPTMVYVRESHVEKLGHTQDVGYEILNVLDFNSTRKRQSVVCRYPDGRLVLYCKGADTVVFERLANVNEDLKKVSRDHLEQFGSSGLRTLCLAFRDLSPDMYATWNDKFVLAKSALQDRERKLGEVAELIEKDLILIGCTAIEDKLQDGVPSCIKTLSKAGIKIWVLTGDKMETAINVGYSCNLINNQMKQFLISSETDAIREAEVNGNKVEIDRVTREEVKRKLNKCLEEAQQYQYLESMTGPTERLALVIDGKCLTYALLDRSLKAMLLKLSLNCTSVVCCRVSPLQKAQVTSLVRKDARKITLGIGDGSNDVSMIQAAHVGVGISGLEGMQAVMASDFSIAQFRFLTDLLLIHGRWSYYRICKVVSYFLYKNVTFTLTQFWFTFRTGYSGQRFYDDWFQSLYNILLTALPVMVLGLFEKDVSASLSKKYPELYKEGIRNSFFNGRIVAVFAVSSLYHSIILYHLVVASSSGSNSSSGRVFGHWDVSTLTFTYLVITVNLRVLVMSSSITKWHYITVGGSILAWFMFAFVNCALMTTNDENENVFYVIYILMGTDYFYVALLIPVIALLADFIYLSIQRWFFPYDYQIVQEIHRDEQDDETNGNRVEVHNEPTPEDARNYAMTKLPREVSRNSGFSFDSPGYESLFASASYVARKASIKPGRKSYSILPTVEDEDY